MTENTEPKDEMFVERSSDVPLVRWYDPDAPDGVVERDIQFVTSLNERMGEIRTALDAVIRAAVPGGAQRAADLRHGLNIDSKLACQIYDVWRAPNAVDAASRLPSIRRLERLADSALVHRVKRDVVDLLRTACQRLGTFIEDRAGERWVFDAIIECLGDTEHRDALAAIELRRAAMQSASRLFGSVMDCSATIGLLRRSETADDRLDLAWISIRRGVRRLAPGLAVPIAGRRFFTGNSVTRDPVYVDPPQPIFPPPTGAPEASHLVQGFCDPELPPIRVRVTPSAIQMTELIGDDVGESSRAALVFASISKQAVHAYSGLSAEGGPSHYSMVDRIRVACRQHAMIVGIDESCGLLEAPVFMLQPDQHPEFRGHATQAGPASKYLPVTRFDRLFDEDPFGIAGMGELTARAVDALGWDSGSMSFFGVGQQYPSLMGMVRAQLVLPEPPDDSRTDT